MRKLYALLAGLCFALTASVPTHAQQPTNDVANFTFTVDAPNNHVIFTNTSVLNDAAGIRRAFWSFGDGSGQWTLPLAGTQHHYQGAGTYTVCLKIYRYTTNTGDSVLSAEVCKTVTIETICRANFEYRDSLVSVNPLKHLVKFWAIPFHNANKPVVQVCWNFGDGTDTCINITSNTPPANLLTIQHTYYQQGPFTVCVRIKYQDGCVAEKCKSVILHEPPADSCRADFERLPLTTTNNPLTATFKALPWHSSNKPPARICWSFGDGRDTCIQYSNTNPGPYTVTHTYSHPGLYEVCVKILYVGGCEARKCKPVQIGREDSCKADFERLPVSISNNPLTVIYKALPWHNNHRKPKTICWQFGDGRDTCINYSHIYTGSYIVAHTYREPGLYETCVKILYYGGCEARKCKPVQVGRPDSCKADFERIPLATADNPLVAGFRALPWHNNNKKPKTICWTFGDGRDTCINYGPDYSGQYVVRHQYREPGQYEVCVKILYYGGCEARKCKLVAIHRPDSCRADFERVAIATTDNPRVAVFKALPWHNNNKKPKTICWKFGDGSDTCINYDSAYTGQYLVRHLYQQPGQYEVCVKILYYGGCEARKCKLISIPHDTCAVRLHEITPSINSLVRGFYAAVSSVPPSRPERICWYFGDGTDTCIVATPGNPVDLLIRHTYPAPGVYRACVKVLFANGCRATDCEEVVIRSHNNVCGGFMTDSMVGPRTFKFKGFAIHNPNDQVLSYRWSFGDGTTAIGREVTHTYNSAGDFEVCLYIKTALGCETRICKKVRVPGNNQPALTLTPNPVVNILHALFLSTHTETVTIKIINSNGVVIRTTTRNATIGPNNWDFDLSNLTAGVYSFVVQSPNQLASAIFIKL